MSCECYGNLWSRTIGCVCVYKYVSYLFLGSTRDQNNIHFVSGISLKWLDVHWANVYAFQSYCYLCMHMPYQKDIYDSLVIPCHFDIHTVHTMHIVSFGNCNLFGRWCRRWHYSNYIGFRFIIIIVIDNIWNQTRYVSLPNLSAFVVHFPEVIRLSHIIYQRKKAIRSNS